MNPPPTSQRSMLARLIASYGKSQPALESTTDEQESRLLLWPSQPSSYGRDFQASPPSTPVGSPTFRVGPFDDRGGLELNESKDVRIVVAQDAFGHMDKPLTLYDTQVSASEARNSTSANSGDQPVPLHQRQRSSTMSGNASAWSRSSRSTDSADQATKLLECMFGATYTTKAESSTKMHVLSLSHDIPSDDKPVPLGLKMTARTPLVRAHTSTQTPAGRTTENPPKDNLEELILVTRMFSVALPESKEPMSPLITTNESTEFRGKPEDHPLTNASKKTKLVEKKVPMYAVGILFGFPRLESRTFSRPPSRTSLTSSGFPGSLGSDIASSWTLLEAIPDSLSSSVRSRKHSEYKAEAITNQWEVILRCLAHLEDVTRREVLIALQQVDRDMMSSLTKTPKGPHEQRTNQRNVYIRQQLALSGSRPLLQAGRQTIQRICSSFRIPRAITGAGLNDGRWLDEARFLVQSCGLKSHNFFLYNLLTAFLGNHTQWLDKIGLQALARSKGSHGKQDMEGSSLCSRTVVVADQRSIARRLVFLLASFLPPAPEEDMTEQMYQRNSPLATPSLSFSSPARRMKTRNAHVSFGADQTLHLSTSASSTASVSSIRSPERPTSMRKTSDAFSTKASPRYPLAGAGLHLRKTSRADSAISSQPATSVPHYIANRDGYFPEVAVDDSTDSAASADLARILRRDSSNLAPTGSSSGSWAPRLTSFWPKVSSHSPEMNQNVSSAEDGGRSAGPVPGSSQLDSMVKEAAMTSSDTLRNDISRSLDHANPVGLKIDKPRLKVDESDGVIDVDIGIPGFFTWDGDEKLIASSPTNRPSSSATNLESHRSFRSSFSHPKASRITRVGSSDVAGYLNRYHEDFTLQAIRPYSDIAEEIQQSMLREFYSLHNATLHHEAPGEAGREQWTNISATLVADLRTLTIERITLQARRPTSSLEPSSSTLPQKATDNEIKFDRESVMDFDATLTDAIEKILVPTAKSSAAFDWSKSSPSNLATSARTASSSPLANRQALRRPELQPQPWRSHCGEVVADALQEVVKSVNQSLNMRPGSEQVRSGSTDLVSHENALREGVKQWLLKSEAANVW